MNVLRWWRLLAVVAMGLGGDAASAEQGRHPLVPGVDHVVFAVRQTYEDSHWYANIGYFCDDHHQKAYSGNGGPSEGRLMKLDLRTGQAMVLLDAEGGSIRDPQVHYDGKKAIFSYLKAGTDHYHLYEIQLDGSGLRQLTDGPYDDYEPAYLPDGGIVFVSTRCRSWVACWMTQVGVLYRCDADGGDIRRLSFNTAHDNTPWVLPDGRILYTRWEYVDRSQVEFHHLWTMNPDGTNQQPFYGNMHPGIVMIAAKPIPGSDEILATFSPGHGINDHRGFATIVSPKAGPDEQRSARQLHGRPALIKDPYPVSLDVFLVAHGKEIRRMDRSGNMQTLYTWDGDGQVYEPRAIRSRPAETVIPPRVQSQETTGRLFLADIYRSRELEGVARGEIKRLLVLEDLPKPVNFSGGPDLVSWLGQFTLNRVLGTVPVEEDGSAFFEIPAGRPIFFVALDENDLSVKRMHSFTTVMPGEVTGCVGCHEPRTNTPELGSLADIFRRNRPPHRIEPFDGFPDVLDFTRDIQPILDQHCVACHGPERREAGVLLSGDLGPVWSHSYFSLLAHLQVADGRNGLGNYPPRTIGSSASPLLEKLGGGHHEVVASPEQWRTVWLWIESGAPFAGSYAGLRNAVDQGVAGRATGRVFGENQGLLQERCGACHALRDPQNEQARALPFRPLVARAQRGVPRAVGIHERVVIPDDPLTKYSEHILLNFSQPEKSSLLLAPRAAEAGGYESCGAIFADTNDPAYQRLLASLSQGRAELDAQPRYGAQGFVPNHQYIRELIRFGILPPSFDSSSQPLDVFRADQDYWRSLWLQPRGHDGRF